MLRDERYGFGLVTYVTIYFQISEKSVRFIGLKYNNSSISEVFQRGSGSGRAFVIRMIN